MPFSTPDQLQKEINEAHTWAANNNPDVLPKTDPTDIGRLAAAAIAKNEASGKVDVSPAGLDTITNLEIRKEAEHAFELSKSIFESHGLTVPTPEDFVAIRPDIYAALVGIYEQMERDGKEPRVVIAPNIDGPKTKDVLGDKYNLLDWQKQNAQELKTQNEQYLKDRGSTVVEINNSDGTTTLWTISIMPAAPKPQDLNKTYDEIAGQTCTISEYNTLQAYLLVEGKEPIDTSTWTWQHGRINVVKDGKVVGGVSPCGDWRDSRVYANFGVSGYRGSSLGRRSPGVV
jgi:hypothetical protein